MENFLTEVVVMEDDKKTQRAVSNVLKRLGFRVTIVNDAQSALNRARRRKTRKYILDINMGQGKEQEGLNALELLKDFDENIFVGVLSGYPNRYQQWADKLNVDHFQAKTTNTERDVFKIVSGMLVHEEEVYQKQINEFKRKLSGALQTTKEDLMSSNVSAYKILRNDKKWLSENSGYYIAFIHGKPKGKSKDRNKLLKEIRKENPDDQVFIIYVSEYEEVIDLPSPLEILGL